MSELTSIQSRLRAIRKAAGLTQAALAARLECTPKRVANIELGTRRPSLALIEQWASACGHTFGVLLSAERQAPADLAAAMEALAVARPEIRSAVLKILIAGVDANPDALEALDSHLNLWVSSFGRRPGRSRGGP